jgi:hypothetical protein
LGEILDDQKYEQLNFFDYKPNKNKQIPKLEIKEGILCVPLESRNENLNYNINSSNATNVNNLPINNNILSANNQLPPLQVPFHPMFHPYGMMLRPHMIPQEFAKE